MASQVAVDVRAPGEKKRRNSIDKGMSMLGNEAQAAATLSLAVGEANEKAMFADGLTNTGSNDQRGRRSSAIKGVPLYQARPLALRAARLSLAYHVCSMLLLSPTWR